MVYGRGAAALFAGPSGCGKTMTAQIMARDLDVECFQVDVSKTNSKNIGETVKSLGRVFDAAERASAVLLFDEANALFGKRIEEVYAHESFANVEVTYLLHRMEVNGGNAILTTKLKQNLDQAFLHRLRFVIDLPIPNPAAQGADLAVCLPAQSATRGAHRYDPPRTPHKSDRREHPADPVARGFCRAGGRRQDRHAPRGQGDPPGADQCTYPSLFIA